MNSSDITASQSPALKQKARKRSLEELLAPLDSIAAQSASLIVNRGAIFESNGRTYEIPRYIFIGPQGGGTPIRVGIFAGIHGDEPEGSRAIVQFIKLLELKPELAAGYCLYFYPVCNPTGFEDDTRHSRNGKDLNREFWINSDQPEIRLLQADLSSRSFDGIIALHTDDTADGFYGIAQGATLTKHLIHPVLKTVEAFLPVDKRARIDGFPARNGIVEECYKGVLSAPPKQRPRPFEVILETPKAPPSYLKESAFVLGLRAILGEYLKLISYAQNI